LQTEEYNTTLEAVRLKQSAQTTVAVVVTAIVTAAAVLGIGKLLYPPVTPVALAPVVTTSASAGNTTNNTTTTTATTTTATNNNAANVAVSDGSQTQPLQLTPFTFNNVQMEVPSGWSKGAIGGGDWTGWKFANPSDPNQEIIVISSSCVGCAANPKLFTQGTVQPDARNLLPADAQNVVVSTAGTSATYNFTDANGNPNQGQSAIHVTIDSKKQVSGYMQAKVFLPAADATLTQQILTSLQ